MNRKHESPVERAVDLFVFAPIGLAYEALDLLPKLVERGRGQVGLLRLAGDMAVKRGAAEMEKRSTASAPRPVEPNGTDSVADESRSELPIADYETLAAAQVVKRLEGLNPSELEAVRRHEDAGRHRVTILNKISRLQG